MTGCQSGASYVAFSGLSRSNPARIAFLTPQRPRAEAQRFLHQNFPRLAQLLHGIRTSTILTSLPGPSILNHGQRVFHSRSALTIASIAKGDSKTRDQARQPTGGLAQRERCQGLVRQSRGLLSIAYKRLSRRLLCGWKPHHGGQDRSPKGHL